MNKEMLELVTPFVRHALTLVGTLLAGKGLVDGSDVETLSGGAALLVNFAWVIARVIGKKKAQTATAQGSGTVNNQTKTETKS